MKSPRILFLVSGKNVPSTRYRVLPYLPHLRASGYTCDVAYSFPEKYGEFKLLGWRGSQILKQLTRRFQLLQAKLKNYDILFVEREIFDLPTWDMEQKFRAAIPRMILDVDDAIFLRYPDKFAAIAGMSTLVLAGNRSLMREASKFCDQVALFPTVVETAEYDGIDCPAPPAVPVIGWIGTESNVPFLETIQPALEKLAESELFVLRVITGERAAVECLANSAFQFEFRQWNSATAEREISQFTVGVMPLPDDHWQRHKCGFKLIQYMAAGVPAVASPVGVNSEIIQHGVNGYLATGEAEWCESLRVLLKNPELRNSLAEAGKNTIQSSYSVSRNLSILTAAFDDLLQR